MDAVLTYLDNKFEASSKANKIDDFTMTLNVSLENLKSSDKWSVEKVL